MDKDIRRHGADARDFIYRHLTAAMLMQPLEQRLSAEDSVEETLAHLNEVNFDISVFVDGDQVFFIERESLRSADLRTPIREWARHFPSSRIISSTMPLGPLAERLNQGQIPLLAVGPDNFGRGGPQYIVTRSDFSAPAGVAAALCLVAVLDSGLASGLSTYSDEEILAVIPPGRRTEAEKSFREAVARGEETREADMLHLSDRLTAWNRLHPAEEKLCSSKEAGSISTVRNDLTHGRLAKLNGDKILNFVTKVSRTLDALDVQLARMRG